MSNKWCDDEIYHGKMRRSKNRIPRRISAKRSEPSHLMTANTDRTRSLLVVCQLWFLLDFAYSHRQKKTKENKRACTWNFSYNEIFINAFRNCEGSSLISSSNVSVFTGQHYKTQLFQTLAKTKQRTESNWKLGRSETCHFKKITIIGTALSKLCYQQFIKYQTKPGLKCLAFF